MKPDEIQIGPCRSGEAIPARHRHGAETLLGRVRRALVELEEGQCRDLEFPPLRFGPDRMAKLVHHAADIEDIQVAVRTIGKGTTRVWRLGKTTT